MTSLLDVPKIEIYKKLFELRNFDFITVRNGFKHEKQKLALECLTGGVFKEVAYGGAAGGAKSWTGCAWLAFMCMLYPGTRWFIAREELKRLRESTLMTFFKVAAAYSFQSEFKYNGQDHCILFSNGSRIDLLEMSFLPSDPLFERYGSAEYTGGFVEEAGETVQMAYDTLKSRCGRQYNDKYNIKPIIYISFNPKKNYVYSYFYQRSKAGTLPPYITFITALLYDNPHREKEYEEQLKQLSSIAQKERLLYGNFEYDDDPAVLCDYDAICDCFTNDHVKRDGNKRLSADLAMQGRDSFIAGSADGMVITIEIDKPKATGKEIQQDLQGLMNSRGIARSKTVADSDGLGAYIGSYLDGIKEFHGNASAFDVEYANLKSECAYKLAEFINKRFIKIICTPEQMEKIKEELGVLKAESVDADEKKKRIIKKDMMKQLLGRSPDYLDMLLMMMYFEVDTNKHVWGIAY